MDENEKVTELSALMPLPERLEAMAMSIVSRVGKRARLRDALPAQLLRWAGPALAIGSGLALSLWLVGAPDTSEPSSQLSQWAMNNEVPAARNILETLDDQPMDNAKDDDR